MLSAPVTETGLKRTAAVQSQVAPPSDLVADQEVGAVRRQQLQQGVPKCTHHLERRQVQGDLGARLPTVIVLK